MGEHGPYRIPFISDQVNILCFLPFLSHSFTIAQTMVSIVVNVMIDNLFKCAEECLAMIELILFVVNFSQFRLQCFTPSVTAKQCVSTKCRHTARETRMLRK